MTSRRLTGLRPACHSLRVRIVMMQLRPCLDPGRDPAAALTPCSRLLMHREDITFVGARAADSHRSSTYPLPTFNTLDAGRRRSISS